MNINLSPLREFRNLEVRNDKSILINMDSGISSVKTYSGPLSAMKRTNAERFVNNDMRERLLDALANAFGMAGEVTLSAGKNGRAVKHYSSTLIDTLERHLGKEFKRSDFGFSKDGAVESGRPLTQRRVSSILNRVDEIKYNLSDCSNRLEEATDKLKGCDATTPAYQKLAVAINQANKCLELLKKDTQNIRFLEFSPVTEHAFLQGSAIGSVGEIEVADVKEIARQIDNYLDIKLDLERFGVTTVDDLTEERVQTINDHVLRETQALLEALLEIVEE